jgi:hypothetical protein
MSASDSGAQRDEKTVRVVLGISYAKEFLRVEHPIRLA